MNNNQPQSPTVSPYGHGSMALLAVAVFFFLLTSVILDSTLAGLSNTIQRLIIVLTVILPNLAGTVLGVLELRHPNRRVLLAWMGIVLNGLMAIFFIFLISFAG